jgi:hypothetical protein
MPECFTQNVEKNILALKRTSPWGLTSPSGANFTHGGQLHLWVQLLS